MHMSPTPAVRAVQRAGGSPVVSRVCLGYTVAGKNVTTYDGCKALKEFRGDSKLGTLSIHYYDSYCYSKQIVFVSHRVKE